MDLKGKRTVVTQGWLSLEGLAWGPDDKEIWFAGTINTGGWADAIHAVSLSGKERVVLSVPWVRLHDVAKDGQVLLSRESWRRQLVGFFPGDRAEHPCSWLDSTNPTAISNDGHWLSFSEAGEVYALQGDKLGYYRRTDGSAAISLGAGAASISPDGKWILTYGRRPKLLLQPVGAGEPKELPTPGLTVFDTADWSGDGRQIVYEALTSENEWNVYTQRIDEGPPVLVKAKRRNAVPTLSSDGTTVALHEGNGVSGGIFLYTAGSKPIAAKGVAASSPHRLRGHSGAVAAANLITGLWKIAGIDNDADHPLNAQRAQNPDT